MPRRRSSTSCRATPELRGPLRPAIDAEVIVARFFAESVVNSTEQNGGHTMLWTIAVILLVLWALGLVSSFTMGGFIHLLLVLAIVVVLIRVIQGRSPVA